MGTLDDALAHFGVKGMKWGVRRSHPHGSSSDSSSEDARRASAARQKIKTSGRNSLSNRELQDLVNRMNLEQQLDRLQGPSTKAKAGKFVADVLVNVGKQQATKLASDFAAKQLAELLKKAAK